MNEEDIYGEELYQNKPPSPKFIETLRKEHERRKQMNEEQFKKDLTLLGK